MPVVWCIEKRARSSNPPEIFVEECSKEKQLTCQLHLSSAKISRVRRIPAWLRKIELEILRKWKLIALRDGITPKKSFHILREQEMWFRCQWVPRSPVSSQHYPQRIKGPLLHCIHEKWSQTVMLGVHSHLFKLWEVKANSIALYSDACILRHVALKVFNYVIYSTAYPGLGSVGTPTENCNDQAVFCACCEKTGTGRRHL